MATTLASGVKKQGDGKFSVRVGNQKFNGLSRSEANSRSNSKFQVAPDSLTDSPNQKARNLSLGIKAGDSNARRDSALRGTITSASLNPAGNIQLPTQNFGDNQMSTITGNNQGLTNTSMGITTTETGGLAYTPPTDGTTATATDPATNNFQAYLNTIQGLNDKKESASDVFKRIEKQSGLRQAQQDVQNYTSQINTITSNAQAQSLSLEGQGRGQTGSFVGGEQARISREAAIQALPIQALLANAQGNKELAQTHLDTRFKLEMQDAQSQYDYKLKVVGAVYEFASTQEKRRLDEIAQEKANEFTLKRDEAQFTRDKYMKQMGINADMAMFNAKLSAENKANETTPADKQKQLDQFSFLRDTIAGATKLAGAAGPNMLTKGLGNVFVGNTKVKQLDAKINTLKVNMLTLGTDPDVKKFFGPQMSDADVRLMTSTGTTLDAYNNSEKDLRAELQRYDNLMNRMQTAVSNGRAGGNMLTAPSGELIQIID